MIGKIAGVQAKLYIASLVAIFVSFYQLNVDVDNCLTKCEGYAWGVWKVLSRPKQKKTQKTKNKTSKVRRLSTFSSGAERSSFRRKRTHLFETISKFLQRLWRHSHC